MWRCGQKCEQQLEVSPLTQLVVLVESSRTSGHLSAHPAHGVSIEAGEALRRKQVEERCAAELHHKQEWQVVSGRHWFLLQAIAEREPQPVAQWDWRTERMRAVVGSIATSKNLQRDKQRDAEQTAS